MEAGVLAETVREICAVPVDDGMRFDRASIVIDEIRDSARYGGLRVRLVGRLGKSRTTVQLDVGYGDAVTPGLEEADYPTLLDDQPAPRLRVYPRASVVAEKREAIVSLGMASSRLKDYFDLRALAREGLLDAQQLADAVAATFARRGTAVPTGMPLGLTEAFAHDPAKLAQWRAFLGQKPATGADTGTGGGGSPRIRCGSVEIGAAAHETEQGAG